MIYRETMIGAAFLSSRTEGMYDLERGTRDMAESPSAFDVSQGAAATPYRPSVSVVVPALNEQDTLKHVVEWTASLLGGVADDFEIIIVDDGSTDETGRIADALAALSSNIKVIHNPRPSGYGGALESGFRG